MNKMNKTNLGLTFVGVALAALLMAPTAAAECVQDCDPEKMSGCAQGQATGAAGAAGGGVICLGVLNIQISVFGDMYSCTVVVYNEASACDGGSEGEVEAISLPDELPLPASVSVN